MEKTKDVALVLASGGPRGWAYIGAIEELESRGYNITSVAGTSVGSLIGGIYAAGFLPQIKEWLYNLDGWKVFKLMDLSISMTHLVKGDKVIAALKQIVPEVNIEDLKIPYRAVATDLYTGEAVVFDKGPLFDAIRASISIPSLFRPVRYGNRVLIDGGIVDTLPIDRAVRNGHDILVAFDVNDVDVDGINRTLALEEQREEEQAESGVAARERMNKVIHSTEFSLLEKVKIVGSEGYKAIAEIVTDSKEDDLDIGNNYYDILSRTFSLMNHVNSENSMKMYKPDVLAKMPFDAFDEIADYAKAPEIAEIGRALMKEALDKYEASLD